VSDTTVKVVPYDTSWPQQFERERSLLQVVLAPWLDGGIHHVGSTSVPGLAAKPIIDMIAGVRALDTARAAFDPLLAQDYAHDPHRPGIAHHFVKPSCSLHLTEVGSDLWRERLAFRDALRRDDALARDYAALKLQLAQVHATDPAAYLAGKRAFVGRVLADAGLIFGRR
jgi:GrpB-like predicted nucleotidyltransferase (UPF0157 family)